MIFIELSLKQIFLEGESQILSLIHPNQLI